MSLTSHESLFSEVRVETDANCLVAVVCRRPTFSETKRVLHSLLSVFEPSSHALQALNAPAKPSAPKPPKHLPHKEAAATEPVVPEPEPVKVPANHVCKGCLQCLCSCFCRCDCLTYGSQRSFNRFKQDLSINKLLYHRESCQLRWHGRVAVGLADFSCCLVTLHPVPCFCILCNAMLGASSSRSYGAICT